MTFKASEWHIPTHRPTDRYITISFGKHAGQTLWTLLDSDPSYLLWLCTKPFVLQHHPDLWRWLCTYREFVIAEAMQAMEGRA